MKAARRQQIERLADMIRDACGCKVPLDMAALKGIVVLLGGVLEEVKRADFEARIEKTETAFKITIAKEFMETRQKFSIAHELGHLFLHMGYLVDDTQWQNTQIYTDSVRYRYGRSREEYEANEFAAAFLMPRAEFSNIAFSHLEEGQFNVDAIANDFDVSRDFALTRGRWLGLFPWE